MSNRCPITYEPLSKGQKYSAAGLRQLASTLIRLEDLPLSAQEQRIESTRRAGKMSIQGVQPKLSAILRPKESRFEIVDKGGRFIFKPQHDRYSQLPENEDLTMRMAAVLGIEVPMHGLLYSKDGSLTYFIRRFDRGVRDQKVAMEDFAQLAGESRETKYNYSMERLIPLLDQYCTFPVVEKRELFLRTLFNFIIGNEDMHLKNFSLWTQDGKVALAPAYDFLNSTIVLGPDAEEIALPIRGKRKKLGQEDLLQYFGGERLSLSEAVRRDILDRIFSKISAWEELIHRSFLSRDLKEKFHELLRNRIARLR